MNDPLTYHETEPSGPVPRTTLAPTQWAEIGMHTTISAVLVTLLSVTAGVITAVSSGPRRSIPADEMLFFPVMLPVLIVFVGLITGVISALTLSLAYVVDQSLKPGISASLWGAIWGGWICGGNIILFVWLADLSSELPFHRDSLGWLIALIVISTIMGAYGGAVGGWRSMWIDASTAEPTDAIQNFQQFRARFGIRQFIVLSVWVCVISWLTKVTGLLNSPLTPWLGLWAVTLVLSIGVGATFWPRYTRWRVKRWEARKQS